MNKQEELRARLGAATFERLELWGRVMRPQSQVATSPTHDICERLARLAGIPEEVGAGRLPEVLRKEGEAVERAWSQMRHPVEWKIALAHAFIHRLPVHIVARRMRCGQEVCCDKLVVAGKLLNSTYVNLPENEK